MNESELKLGSLHRPGGSNWHERFTYDFEIDGRSLAQVFQLESRDMAGCLDAMDATHNDQVVKALVLEGPPDCAPNRVMIFVCPECADLGCGAITAAVRREATSMSGPIFATRTTTILR